MIFLTTRPVGFGIIQGITSILQKKIVDGWSPPIAP
jgi:hypothetical protein